MGEKKFCVKKMVVQHFFDPLGTKFWLKLGQILLIWTNVTRTNVAWPNVILTSWHIVRWPQKSTFKVWSKLRN